MISFLPRGQWEQSSACNRSSLAILAATRYRIAASRRQLNRYFGVSGSSGDPQPDILRTRLLSGELPMLVARDYWGGPAAEEHHCPVCGGFIAKKQIECEVRNGPGALFYVHPPCFSRWSRASEELRAAQNKNDLRAVL